MNVHNDDVAQLLIITLDEQRYALHLSAIERVIHAVEITSFPKAPETVAGIINLQGRVIPVIDLRRRFGLPQREIEIGDQFVIAHTPRRDVALVVNSVVGVIEIPSAEMIEAEKLLSGSRHIIEGVIKMEDDLILIQNLDRLLSLEAERALDEA